MAVGYGERQIKRTATSTVCGWIAEHPRAAETFCANRNRHHACRRRNVRIEPDEALKPTKYMRVICPVNTGAHLMKKAAVILAAVAALGATVVSAPAEAHGWRHGWGPGPAIGFGLAAGALAAGVAGAYGPYYGPRYYYGGPRYYGYYGPRYRPAYYGGYYGPRYGYGGPRYYRSYGYW
jgi:hypothetical protein